MKVCLARVAELEEKVVQYEKDLFAIKDSFVKAEKEIAHIKANFSNDVTEEERLFQVTEEKRLYQVTMEEMLYQSLEEDMRDQEESEEEEGSFCFVEEEEAWEEEGEPLDDELLESMLFEALTDVV